MGFHCEMCGEEEKKVHYHEVILHLYPVRIEILYTQQMSI